jgi:hypothetical protein
MAHRCDSANSEDPYLTGPAGAVSAMAVHRDLYATGVAEHDVKAVAPERDVITVMQDPSCQQLTVTRRHLDITR